MAVPKHRHSNARTRSRRAHWKITIPESTKCPACNEVIRPYTACSNCGQYKGRQILTTKSSKEQ
ncbi:MAG: 50S ribosomal protein L32 [Candidatus Margulisiibacteriota bacterium]|nr:MAG: 50S ribosomal protein L32 [Candidatus Margulisiibacteriota bacterium]HAR61863.1 50S ribosomal protein L32 [Candidatus Margulisiibacteriota bacterium]HCT84233.1 50S ribosomal protein L32 [Candidatus Margulisiibacteriota bacterium]HCY35524.1 50S ribosomal protein L32 [Candidatus Margulisiibacteriota bacterium]